MTLAVAGGASRAITPTSISRAPAKTRSGGAAGPRSGSTGRARPIPGSGSSGSTGSSVTRTGGRSVNVTVSPTVGGGGGGRSRPSTTDGTLGKFTPVPARIAKRVMAGGGTLNTIEKRLIVGEFLACMLLVTFGPLGIAHKGEGAASWMKRASAILALFFVLGLITTAGKSASKAAAGFGGIVTVAMLVKNRDVFTLIGKTMNTSDPADDSGTEPELPDTQPDQPDQPDQPAEISNPNPRPGPDGPFR